MLVALQAVDRDELVGEAAGVVRSRPAPLRLEREGVLVLARDAPALGDVLARLAHRLEREHLLEPGIGEAPAEGRVVDDLVAAREGAVGLRHHERGSAHRLDAAGDEEVAVSRCYGVRRGDDGGQARRAEPVHGHSGDRVRQSREQRRHPRDVPVVLAGLVRAAEPHILDRVGGNAGALDRSGDRRRGEIVRPHACECAAVASDRSADRREDDGARHYWTKSTRTGCS